jgi:hypothetical protein
MRQDIRVEGIRRTLSGWAIVGTRPGASVVPGRSPRVPVLIEEFAGPGAKARAIRAAGTNTIVTGTARDLIETAA